MSANADQEQIKRDLVQWRHALALKHAEALRLKELVQTLEATKVALEDNINRAVAALEAQKVALGDDINHKISDKAKVDEEVESFTLRIRGAEKQRWDNGTRLLLWAPGIYATPLTTHEVTYGEHTFPFTIPFPGMRPGDQLALRLNELEDGKHDATVLIEHPRTHFQSSVVLESDAEEEGPPCKVGRCA